MDESAFLPAWQRAESGLSLHYADEVAAARLLAGAQNVLGVVGYGAAPPPDGGPFVQPPDGCAFVRAPLAPVAGGPVYEIWQAAGPVRPLQVGPVRGACGEGLVFGALALADVAGDGVEAVIEAAYGAIFDFLDEAKAAPVRFWNYLAAITEDDAGLERYRRFNIGRQRAFLARLRQAVPPAASCLGAYGGGSMIYFLGAREAAEAVENPRQVSAYAYPPVYGPCSPSFSRAGRLGRRLFISGTASIVGHETRHQGDVARQVAETVENLRAVIGQAGMAGARDWAFKIYLRDGVDQAVVAPALDEVFGVGCRQIYLGAEICRTDLLVEIEAFGGN